MDNTLKPEKKSSMSSFIATGTQRGRAGTTTHGKTVGAGGIGVSPMGLNSTIRETAYDKASDSTANKLGGGIGGGKETSQERPTRDNLKASKSPKMNTQGGRSSAERLRKHQNDSNAAYEDRMDDMNTNIAHFDHHGDPKIKKKAQIAAKSTGLTTKALFPDRLEILKDNNISLKNTQKELESEIKIIATKFKRQITLLKKERMVGAPGTKNAITTHFEANFNELIEENNRLQMHEQELMEKVRKLNQKRKKELANGKTLYSTVNKGIEKNSNAELEGAKVLRGLQQTLNQSKEKVLKLVREIESAKRMSASTLNMEELYRERRETELKLMQVKSRLEDIKSSLKVKSDIFSQGKKYEDSLFNQIKAAQSETSKLTTQNRTLKSAAQDNEDVRQRLLEARQERDRMQNEFDTIMRTPFFKKNSSDNEMKQLEVLQAKLEAKEREIAASKNVIEKTHHDLKNVQDESGQIKKLKGNYEDEIAKMQAHMDPTSLTLNDVMKKLRKEDPSRFREVMEDLDYEGRDPAWYSKQVQDQINSLRDVEGESSLEADSIENLCTRREKLQEERVGLVTELNKIQKLLKLQVDLDKQNAASQKAELDLIKSRITMQTNRSNELSTLLKRQNETLLNLQEQKGPGLTQAELSRFNQQLDSLKNEIRQVDGVDADAMTEVSARTDESELGPQENLLDLRVTSATFDRVQLTQMLMAGQQEIDPSTIQTFLAVDFFNHDTKTTDMTIGIEPIYNTLFSFKNTADDFYIKFLEKDTVVVDIFYIPKGPTGQPNQAASAIKLGVAKLPLHKLIDKDYSFQAQEIMHVGANNQEVPIGKIFYRMRPRKPLDEAIKWYKQKQLVKNEKTVDFSKSNKNNKSGAAADTIVNKKQVVEIEVKSASNLRISGSNNPYAENMMRPFFTYDFYQFSADSAVVLGTDPAFNDKRRFEVEVTPEFLAYMEKTVFKIDFIDESVEMSQAGARDYIGSARIPLGTIDLKTKRTFEQKVEIKDEHQSATGQVIVRMSLYDARDREEMAMYGEALGMMQHKQIHLDVINKIAIAFAFGEFDEIDMYFDMLFMKDSQYKQRVTREMFEDYIMQDIRVAGMAKHDLEIFMKTHEHLARKAFFTRQELKAIFERPFKEARLKAAEREAHQANHTNNMFAYNQFDNPLRTHHEPAAFGSQQAPRRPSRDPQPFAQASFAGDDDLARATMTIGHNFNRDSNDRETFGAKLGGNGNNYGATGPR